MGEEDPDSKTVSKYLFSNLYCSLSKFSDDILKKTRKEVLTFHAFVSLGVTLHEMSKRIFWEKV